MERIGIIVTAHNYGRFLSQCLESVLAQTIRETWRLVVVDDGSTDDTPEIIARYDRDDRVTALRLHGVGLASAANVGIAAIKSEWVIRLDADDWLHPLCLEMLYATAVSRNVDLTYGDYLVVDGEGHLVGEGRQVEDPASAGHEFSPPAAGCLYRRSCWREIGGYNESLRYQEDFDFWLKFTERFQTRRVPYPLYYYRRLPGSMSGNRQPRADARRQVKREAVRRRGKSLPSEGVPVVIHTTLPVDLRLGPEWGLVELHGRSLLDRLLDKLVEYVFLRPITLVAATDALAQWGVLRGLSVQRTAHSFTMGRDLCASWSGEPPSQGPILFCSPFFPLIRQERLPEVLDTLLLFDCTRVDSVTPEVGETMVLRSQGLISYRGDGNGMPFFRQAGGLTALRGDASGGGGRGYVELLPPEDLFLNDVLALRLAEAALALLSRS
ncbi:MAG: glycosyltransferase [Magnetococcales bacterium]|nr:glycosyltransferase [Magnetococcales bacterium]MBF0148970.1 glycosyltransferase [Magnetococcales bacterium]MBF0603036.1 glycosyltransferase [Magnetococcales bacterium]